MRARQLVLPLLTVIVASLMAACSKTELLRVQEVDSGKSVTLKVGQQLQVVTAGNPSTGYSWDIAELSPVLQQSGEPEYATESTLLGAGGTYTFRFKAAYPGEGVLRLIYHRSWETAQPLKVFSLRVNVQ